MLFIDLMWILLPSFIKEKYVEVIEIQYGVINHPEYKMLTLNWSHCIKCSSNQKAIWFASLGKDVCLGFSVTSTWNTSLH